MQIEFSEESGAWLGYPLTELPRAIEILEEEIKRGEEDGEDVSQAQFVLNRMKKRLNGFKLH